jgi:phosphatidylserine/phosphatidylglycerophosphate/cardiolipin synthase-like enzyme
MRKVISIWFHILLAFIFTLATANPQPAMAQDHIVAPSAIQRDLAASSSARQKNLDQLENFVSSPQALQALKTLHLDATQVKNAIPNLNNDEMAELSARSQAAQADFAAGRMSDRDLIIILIAIVGLILIIVAVR